MRRAEAWTHERSDVRGRDRRRGADPGDSRSFPLPQAGRARPEPGRTSAATVRGGAVGEGPTPVIRARSRFSGNKKEALSLQTKRASRVLAEGEGFEPPIPFRVQRFSRPPPSTARPSLRTGTSAARVRRTSIVA